MNKTQFERLTTAPPKPQTVGSFELFNMEDRTLLFGYTCDRDTFHVYLRQNTLHKVLYTFEGEILKYETGATLELDGIVPDKRVYPEACDFEFCSLLTDKGVNIPYTTFDESRKPSAFHGKIVMDNQMVKA